MKLKQWILLAAVLLLCSGTSNAALTNSSDDFNFNTTRLFSRNGQFHLWAAEMEDYLDGTSYPDGIKLGDVYWQKTDTLPASAVEGAMYWDDSDNIIKVHNGTTWISLGAGTFTGGNISADVDLSNGVDIQSSTTTAHTNSIQGYADAGAYKDVLRWTNGAAVTAVLGASDVVFSLASTGLDISMAGVITNAAGITNTGVLTSAGGATNLNTSGSDAVNVGTGTYTGALTLGNNSSSTAMASSAWDISTAGAMSGFSSLSLSGDITMATGKGLKSSTTTAESVGVYGYDVGAGYVGALVITNSATPATVLGNTSGTTAISSSDWTISTAGAMAGIGAITADGLFTGTGGQTLTGTVSINDSATTSTTSIGGGTTTGAITVGGTGTQTISVGTGAGIKTVAVGSANTTSTTTILGGDNGVNINVDALDNPTNINTGVNTGTVTIGGTGAQTIDIGAGGTGAKTITIGDNSTATSTAIMGGSGDITLTSSDDISLVGAAGSLLNIGAHAGGVAVHIADDDSNADTISIGSAKDTATLAGISVTVGSTGTTSATVIQSGSGEVKINESNNQPVSIGTGTGTGTVTLGGTGTQAIDIGNGAGIKTVAVGSNTTTSATTILSGTTAGALALNASAGGAVTNIGTGTTTGTVTVGGTGTQAIAIGNGAGIKTVAVGSTNTTSATVISSGSGDLDINGGGAVDVDAVTTFDVLAGGAFSIDGSNAASNISLVTDSAADDFTIGLTGATNSSILLSSTGTGADAIGLTATAGGISATAAAGAIAMSGLTGHTITSTAVADGGKGTTLSGTIAGATASEGVGAYVEGNITGNVDGKVYAFGSWLNITGTCTPTDGPDAIFSGADIGIYVAADPELANAKLRVLNLEYQVHADAAPINDTTSMIHFNADSGGDVPDYLFTFGNSDAAVYTANATHTAAATDKVGAIKISITGAVADGYIYVYSHPGQ